MKKTTRQLRFILTALLCLTIALSWQWNRLLQQPVVAALGPPETVTGDRPIEPIPKSPELNADKVKLGDRLYRDPQLSKNNLVSCASCHTLDRGGTDRRTRSVGVNGAVGLVNAPTVFNSSLHFKQFWDGRAESLEAQIDGPINNPIEMGSSWPEVVEKLQKSSEYIALFKQVYPDGITGNNIKNAIATYEQSLNTPDSPFDRFLQGDDNALNANQKQGYQNFKDYGCVSCHQGILLGGNMFQKFGVFGDYFQDRGQITKADYGRFNVTNKSEDRFVFKVPSLRNVELTSPYFHDGSAATLDQAVKVMVKYQLGREAPQQDIDAIVEFLTTLTGQTPGASS
jgi:cytochrome c peroxidase